MRRWRRLLRWRKQRIEVGRGAAVLMERRVVGTCGSCGGPVVYVPGVHSASCPCGDSVLYPALFSGARQMPVG